MIIVTLWWQFLSHQVTWSCVIIWALTRPPWWIKGCRNGRPLRAQIVVQDNLHQSFKPIKLSKVLSDFQVNFNPLYYVEAAGVNPRSGDTRLVSSQQEEKWERQHFGEFFLGKWLEHFKSIHFSFFLSIISLYFCENHLLS